MRGCDPGKSQAVRLIDVYALGPFMVWSGVALARSGRPAAGAVLGASGLATIVYNGRNYLRLRGGANERD